jgi:hypothetical protein
MSGTNDELDVARQALVRARDDLMGRLAGEPAWRALQQLEAGEAGRGTRTAAEEHALRADLYARLDSSFPKWRTLADIDSAIAALGKRAAARSGSGVQLPPPPPVTLHRVPYVRVDAERTRYASQTRPAAAASRPLDVAPPKNARQTLKRADTTSASTKRRKSSKAGGRLVAALGLAGEGPARLSAIESEVERLMRREAGTWDATPAVPAKTAPSERPAVEPMVDLPADGEEAEVEIVQLGQAPQRDERHSASRLSDRLDRAGGDGSSGPAGASVISMQASFEEASVEIEVQEREAPARLLLPDKDDSES